MREEGDGDDGQRGVGMVGGLIWQRKYATQKMDHKEFPLLRRYKHLVLYAQPLSRGIFYPGIWTIPSYSTILILSYLPLHPPILPRNA